MEAFDQKLALVFPGQGAQFVGMGAGLYEQFPEARAVYDQADEVLGFSLSRACFEGPAEVLDDTATTQPAIYTTSYALWRALVARICQDMPRIGYVAGHSLGEYTALAAAGAIGFEDGLRLVRCRGEAMRDAGAAAPGGMAVILGLDDDAVAAIVADAGVWMANLNSPGQVVIAGEGVALERACRLATERGAKRAQPLAVSVACHTPLMGAAAERLGRALAATEIAAPLAPVVSNVTARPTADAGQIRANLLRQLCEPVRWTDSVRAMAEGGVRVMLEVGPKAVVSGLVKRIDRAIATRSVTSAEEIASLDSEVLVA